MHLPRSRALELDSPALRLAAQGLGFALLTAALVLVLSVRDLPLLLAIAAGLACLWLAQNPHWGVFAIFASWFLRFSPVLLGSRFLPLTYIFAAVLCLPLALRLLRDREVWVWRVPQVRYLAVIGAIFLLSSAWADYKFPVTYFPDLDRTREFAQDFITHFIFLVFFLYFVDTRRKIMQSVWLAVALVVASVASAYLHLFSFGDWRRANASFGVGMNPTSFPFVALFGASILWCYYLGARTPRWKGWLVPVLVALPVMAIATGSRTALLQLVAFAALLFMDRGGHWSRSKRFQGLVLLACVAVLVSVVVPTVAFLRSTSFSGTSAAPGAQSLTDRLHTISDGLALVASNPVLGVGIGNFLWLHTALYGLNRLPHNSYLWAAAEGGLGVLALYLLLLLETHRMLRTLLATAPPDLRWLVKGLRLNLILLLVYSLSDDAWLTNLFYFLLATTAALYWWWGPRRLARREHLTEPRAAAGVVR